ncbi:probable nucleoredoxin 1 [Phtheirospermum japonicum]|uniref:Probable nucleoredoxin 1 n=1 Tax=Phtheirospermum japonicum TaxID=374723 RepID=A0A830D223_9LAMI|nr:probable nucleoredoxin 1 [Phtheirospermum japonicum]
MDRKTTSQPKLGTIATHFSHSHPLELVIYKQTLYLASSCAGCKQKPVGMIYSCTSCNYFLHKKCFEMPKKLKILLHQKHTLTLHPKPAYPQGHYKCNACGERGKGFSYHCEMCGFDLHLNCARGISALLPPSQQQHRTNSRASQSHKKNTKRVAAGSSSSPMPQPGQGYGPGFPAMTSVTFGIPAGGDGQIQQMISNNQAMIQAILAGQAGGNGGGYGGGYGGCGGVCSGGLGGYGGAYGGGYGSDMGLQQMMQLISGFSNGGIGEGQDFVESLMDGGGGVDFLSGLLGGFGF